MKVRKMITAEEGHVLTNGEIYGKVIFLAVGQKEKDFYEITEEEYRKIMKDQEEAILGDGGLE